MPTTAAYSYHECHSKQCRGRVSMYELEVCVHCKTPRGQATKVKQRKRKDFLDEAYDTRARVARTKRYRQKRPTDIVRRGE